MHVLQNPLVLVLRLSLAPPPGIQPSVFYSVLRLSYSHVCFEWFLYVSMDENCLHISLSLSGHHGLLVNETD